ncbi:MAG TPA: GTPase HflX [Candidatus Hypogeohydataceae bacterium YC40]
MVQEKRKELSVRAERAILLGTLSLKGVANGDIEELNQLAKTAGVIVVENVLQRRDKIDPTYYIGRGKAEELATLCRDNDIDVVICDDDLTPAQVRNLEKLLNAKVVDRSELILYIFATRARTTQAQLQVELAQLEYTLPRLRRMWVHLDRIEGGIGTRGPGEKQLESDRRLVSKRIFDLRKKLKEIEGRRHQQVTARSGCLKVSLVGYTNAGKSTLMNALTQAGVLVEDRLFSTLDTKTRILHLENGRKALISDTVGFIKKLPHHLVSSFHATLEEVRQADLLLHVVDVSSSTALEQIKAVNEVLEELNCEQKPTLLVLNKADALTEQANLTFLKSLYPESAVISALTGEGIPELKKKIQDYFDRRCVELRLTCGAEDGKLTAYLYQKGHVLSQRLDGQKLSFHLLIEERYIPKISELASDVELSYV